MRGPAKPPTVTSATSVPLLALASLGIAGCQGSSH
jgi:hypothetical protein